ncbi:homocysteine S-methyltransferase family protein [Conexibacter sp. JD483]|uniref:homocysteine S-methyltransferase family protein n=1 Tax=unclassified Conexibacter TaxID=2627773 RepID=UPI002717D347|nr:MULTISPECIES: homocysteine S-methyltransferase family protein [unclassified Conexibacter]MDO8184204.1 homocysteine S-methyltransferase family protein [Conexibacter sp. CPCC 205706]MDO8197196.1 homocysteine S-methyltransferase family protein [Conexibacter sp. CPCC 205762]MDR9367489.1 homocysteine S-methyltransferase family protein [Conexibacter sp. JD483]
MFRALLESGAPILADAAIETRIMFETSLKLDPHLQVAALLEKPRGRQALRDVYSTYLDVAWAHGLPLVTGTPTFRASARYVERAGAGGADTVRRLNAEAVAFLNEIRDDGEHEPVFIAGVVGPYGDAYTPGDCLGHLDGADYHLEQVRALTEAGVDLLHGPTFPSVDEAHGVAIAMATTKLPYAIGFTLDHRGRVLDGTRLRDAISRIDGSVAREPAWYAVTCVHPHVAHIALDELASTGPRELARLKEFKANGSRLSAVALAQLDHPESDSPDDFGEALDRLGREFDLQILGGCCGTDSTHLAALARRLEARRVED